MIHTLLKNIGFGLTATAVQDHYFENSPSQFNLAAAVIGFCTWVSGIYLERRNLSLQAALLEEKQSHPEEKRSNSSNLIISSLNYARGLGFVNSIVHFAKRVDTNTANFGNFTTSMFLGDAIDELNQCALVQVPSLRWEKTRFIILLIGDFLSGLGFSPLLNGEKYTPKTISFLTIGLALGISEGVYSYKNDEGLNLKRIMLRRAFKLTAALNLIFALYDVVDKNFGKYTIADDVYGGAVGILLGGVIIRLMQLGRDTPINNAEQNEVLEVKVENVPEHRPLLGLADDRSSILNSEGLDFYKSKNYQEAIKKFENAIDLLKIRNIDQNHSDYKDHHLKLASIYYNLGSAYLNINDQANARTALQTCIDIRRHLTGCPPELIVKAFNKLQTTSLQDAQAEELVLGK